MKKIANVVLLTLGLAISAMPANAGNYERNDDWGWQLWGWGNGPDTGMMMGQGMKGRMGTIDSNNDGVIGDDEAAAHVEAVFVEMDGDDDGELTNEEYMNTRMGPGPGMGGNEERMKAMQGRKQARFGEMDADKNAKVSQAEFIAGGKARFLASDADKDGKVTPWEFRAQRWQ
jgi:hypothetical protein